MDILKSIEHEQLKNKIPELRIGNTVRVHVRIKEGNKERIQVFEGIIIKKQGGGVNATFTVRRISYGVGVEKTFLVHSPMIEKVDVVRVGKSRRAKLYYLRDRVGKAAKTKEKVGARIENREIVVKEEVVPGESEVQEELTEEIMEEAVQENKAIEEAKAAEEAKKAEAAAEAEAKVEVKEEPAKEVKAVKEEVKAEPATEEVKEEVKKEVKAEPATEEVKEKVKEESAEEVKEEKEDKKDDKKDAE